MMHQSVFNHNGHKVGTMYTKRVFEAFVKAAVASVVKHT